MLYKTLSAAVYGIDANLIEVEVDIAPYKGNDDGKFITVGLPDAAVRESRERVRSALKNSGYDIPPTVTTINLAPADIRKEELRVRVSRWPWGFWEPTVASTTNLRRIPSLLANSHWMGACEVFAGLCPSRLWLGPTRFAS